VVAALVTRIAPKAQGYSAQGFPVRLGFRFDVHLIGNEDDAFWKGCSETQAGNRLRVLPSNLWFD